ncbi:MAG: magnesium transporter CorA family protein [Acidimicrobiales bacterium]|jgi:magnesium transporter
MEGQILLANGSSKPADVAGIRDAVKNAEPFWLDISELDADAIALLADDFKVHPLALEDLQKFGQRPKFETYDQHVYLVMHGAKDDATGTIEVHAFYSEGYLITVHRDPLLVFDQVRTHAAVVRQHGTASSIFLLYRVVDALVDGFFPVLDRFDDEIDALEDKILENPTDEQLGTLFDMKRSLVTFRKVVTPERDVFAGIAAGALELPGMTDDAERYYRDIYDHLIRISDLVDSYRDLLTGAVDTHLSVVSNRLNVVMKQLAVIATIFLPLSFLTGFFGQNFLVLTRNIMGPVSFWAAGIGLEVAAVIGLFVLFKRRHWV